MWIALANHLLIAAWLSLNVKKEEDVRSKINNVSNQITPMIEHNTGRVIASTSLMSDPCMAICIKVSIDV